jgi:hypothetical protein
MQLWPFLTPIVTDACPNKRSNERKKGRKEERKEALAPNFIRLSIKTRNKKMWLVRFQYSDQAVLSPFSSDYLFYGIDLLYSFPSNASLYISATYGFFAGVSAPSSTRRA